MTQIATPIPDDQPVPAEVMALATRMARARRHNRDIADATWLSLRRVAMLQFGGLAGPAKPTPKKWGRRR